MPFDPDQYLAQKEQAPTAGFDPDSYLASKSTPAEITKTHSFLDAASNPFGIEPAVNGAAHAGIQALKDAVLNGKVSLDDIKNTYAKYRDEDKAENQSAKNANPISSFAGDVVGGLPFALATGGGSELAEAPAAAQLLDAVGTGAKFGAAQGVGTGLSDGDNLGDIAKEAGKGALYGAATGGILHGVIGGGKSLLKSAMDVPVLSAPVEGFQQALKGRNLVTKSGAKAATDLTSEMGGKAITTADDMLDEQGKALGGLYGKAADQKFNIQDQHNALLKAIEEARKVPGQAGRATESQLQEIYDDFFKGAPKTLEGEVQPVTLGRTIPAKPSAQEKMLAAQSLLEAKENALPKGLNASVVPSTDESGDPFLNILKETPGEEEGYPNQSIGKTLPDTPGTPEQKIPTQPSGPIVDAKPLTIRTGGVDPNSTGFDQLRKLQSALTQAGGVSGTALPDSQAAASVRSIAQSLGDTVDSANPEIGLTKDKYATVIQALKNLGVKDNFFEKDPLTGVESLTPNAVSKGAGIIQRSARDGETSSGNKAASTVNDFIGKLAQVDYKKAGELNSGIKDSADLFDLMQKTQGLNLFNHSTFLKSGGAVAGNLLGTAVKGTGDLISGVGSELAHSAPVNFAGKVISQATQPLSNTALAQGAKSMLATMKPGAMKLASQLGDAMQKTGTERNAAIFTLMQQPGYRELLKQHVPGLGDENQQ